MGDPIQRRFVEFRFDGERTLSGTVMRYGDVAELPWGALERFEPGAFGDLSNADVTMNVQHDRGKPVSRTGSGLTLTDSRSELSLKAEIVDTRDGNDAIKLVRAKILRGLSVEFRTIDASFEMKDGKRMDIIKRADLLGVGIVDRPAYSKSKVRGERMDEAKVKDAVRTAMAEEGDKREAALVGVVRSELDSYKAEMKRERAEMEAAAERRASLLAQFRSLLPKGFDSAGKSVKDILVAAAGDEISNAANRSEGYLEAKLEGILERRNKAQGKPTQTRSNQGAPLLRPLSVMQMRAMRSASREATQ